VNGVSDGLMSGDEIRALHDLDDWRALYDAIEARFRTRDFATGLEFLNRIGAAAEAADHHPDLTLSYAYVNIVLTSHDVGGKTQRDVDLARQISEIAADLGIDADPHAVQRLELGLDTWARDEIKPFWQAVLAMTDSAPDELTDSQGDNPTIWFQDAARDTDQRWHVDLRVPPEVAQERIDAAVAAGGTIVSTDEAPRFTVLADAQGNKICICTHVGRSR
jgi:4a-hydroxytetrahydrobiopterin dehydratase